LAKEELRSRLSRFDTRRDARSWEEVQASLKAIIEEIAPIGQKVREFLKSNSLSAPPAFGDLLVGLEGKRLFTLCGLQTTLPTSEADIRELQDLTNRLDAQIEAMKKTDAAIASILG